MAFLGCDDSGFANTKELGCDVISFVQFANCAILSNLDRWIFEHAISFEFSSCLDTLGVHSGSVLVVRVDICAQVVQS